MKGFVRFCSQVFDAEFKVTDLYLICSFLKS